MSLISDSWPGGGHLASAHEEKLSLWLLFKVLIIYNDHYIMSVSDSQKETKTMCECSQELFLEF